MNSSIRGLLLIAFLAPLPALAVGESGNVCVTAYQPGATCTANDVRIEGMVALNVLEDCASGVVGEMEVDFLAAVSAAGSPNRYDIGVFLNLEGGARRMEAIAITTISPRR